MRLPYALLIATLLVVPVAAAAGPNAHASDKAREAREAAGARDGNDTPDKRHNETRWDAWHARLKSLLASWHENATAIRERCHAAEKTENATHEQQTSWAHCIRDGYKAFLEAFRADLKAAREARSQ